MHAFRLQAMLSTPIDAACAAAAFKDLGGCPLMLAVQHANTFGIVIHGLIHTVCRLQCDTLPVAAQPSANSISLRYCLVGVGAAPVASAMVHCSRMGRHALLAGRAAVTPGGGAAAVAAGAAHHVSLPWQPLAAAAAASNGDGGAALAGAASAAAAGARVPLDVLLAGDAAGFVTALKVSAPPQCLHVCPGCIVQLRFCSSGCLPHVAPAEARHRPADRLKHDVILFPSFRMGCCCRCWRTCAAPRAWRRPSAC